jgi:tRNA-splicing ligase RtcB
MNNKQLEKIGIPATCYKHAIIGIQQLAKDKKLRGLNVKELLANVNNSPKDYLNDVYFGELAKAIEEENNFVRPEPITYKTWGNEGIEAGSHVQMQQACSMPNAVGAALMPDAHVGYGLPIGGVLALDNAVCPFAVGVDIACRMKMSFLDIPVEKLKNKHNLFVESLENGTFFGVGKENQFKPYHEVLDRDWNVTKITRENKDKARKQLGTSGSGNHFVEFGVVDLEHYFPELDLPPGQYIAIMSHSGSRGTGASVCSSYSGIAQSRLHPKYADLGRLAWLDLDTEAGQEYWNAMNLMGDYAAANHDIIHKTVVKLLGANIIGGVENHHNFAWKEIHNGKEVVVHRKGATPAGKGVLGVIPGSMGDSAYIVRGLGNETSLNSASHGAGRRMSRTAALDKYNFKAVQKDLEKKGITILSAGADEVPGVYKNIDEVMSYQTDLIEKVGKFSPKIVKMCGDGSKSED